MKIRLANSLSNLSGFRWFHLICLLGLAVLQSCTSNEEQCVYRPPVVSPWPMQFESVEEKIAGIETKAELVALLSRYPTFRDGLLGRSNYPDDSIFINTNFSRFSHPAFDTLLLETQRIFGNGESLKQEFQQAFNNLKYYYPDFTPPKIQTVITGLEADLIVTDSVIVIGLDYYLGPTGKYRPQMYQYLLTRYEPEDIVPSCLLMMGIGEPINRTNLEDQTALADMVAYGKSFYFAKHMLPCTADSIFLWYTAEEMKGSKENEDLIWARLIEDEVLFTTSHNVKQKFLGERPKTLEVGEKCPGRIAQWVGWRIVDDYMKNNPEVTLPELMEQSDAQKIFKESRYKPR